MSAQIIVTEIQSTDPGVLARETTHALRREAAGLPIQGGVLFANAGTPVKELRRELALALPGVPFLGSTSCMGVGAKGKLLVGEPALVGLFFLGEEVRFGTHTLSTNERRIVTGKTLSQKALAKANLTGNEAHYAFFFPTPGGEEALLKGAYEELGEHTTLIGGTAADNDLSGNWWTWNEDLATQGGVSIGVGTWPKRTAVSYQGGYLSTQKKARVTRSSGRMIHELNGLPAAEVYNEWLDGALDEFLEKGGSVLGVSTLNPLGVARGQFGGVDAYVLIHPETVIPQSKALTTFAEIDEGETVVLMQSTKGSLVNRGARVAKWAMNRSGLPSSKVAGGLMIYCGGCVLAIQEETKDMLSKVGKTLDPAPWVAGFSFGEQGCVIPRKVDHGNLMASVLLFEK